MNQQFHKKLQERTVLHQEEKWLHTNYSQTNKADGRLNKMITDIDIC